MNPQLDEQISALVDDELNDAELAQVLDNLIADAELQARWRRYRLASDTLRGSAATQRADDLHLRVQQALADEPTVLAPQRKPTLAHWGRRAAGAAIAASVAMVAIVAVQQDSSTPGPTLAVTSSPKLAATTAPPTLAQLASTGRKVERDAALQQAQQERLHAYLINHNEYSSAAGLQGALPYARIVSEEYAR
jgi:negative regulator of sigma E activity